MFYKVLLLEIIACLGLIGLKVYPHLPATTITVGDTALALTPPASDPLPGTRARAQGDAPQRIGTRDQKRTTGQLLFPVAGHDTNNIISVFGDKRGKNRTHEGIDVKAPKGTPVIAVTDGFVERIREGGSGGKSLYLRDGSGRLFYYAHLDDWSVAEFDAVTAGTPLGTVGDTGNARGTTPHLHFEILLGKERRAVDPDIYY